MNFKILLAEQAQHDLRELEMNPSSQKQLKAVRKTLGLMQTNIRHPSLHTHKFSSLLGPKNEEVFEAYAENNTLGAYRIFWHYGPNQKQITVITITPHP